MATAKIKPSGSERRTEWWQNLFEDFRPVFDLIPARDTNAQARYVIKKLGLEAGDRFLDCPCGIGRISLPLARRGIRVTAVDFEKTYLEELKKKAKRGKLPIKVLQADMRRVQFRSQFKAAANLGTSFGYFARESDDLLVLKRMFRSLRRGGKFLLHNVNRDWIIHTFQESDWQEIGDLRILQKRSLDYENSIISSTWRFVRDGKEHSHVTLLRLYSYHEQLRLFERAGFIDVHGYGSVKDDVVDRNHRMLWIIGTKP
jgi:ubiquinone/menaquinone biosynthesis C-methylase UbiE